MRQTPYLKHMNHMVAFTYYIIKTSVKELQKLYVGWLEYEIAKNTYFPS